MKNLKSIIFLSIFFTTASVAQTETEFFESQPIVKMCDYCIELKNLKIIDNYAVDRNKGLIRSKGNIDSHITPLLRDHLTVNLDGSNSADFYYTGKDFYSAAFPMFGVTGGYCNGPVILTSVNYLVWIKNVGSNVYSYHNGPSSHPGYFGICDGELIDAKNFKAYQKRILDLTENIKSLSIKSDYQEKEIQKLNQRINSLIDKASN